MNKQQGRLGTVFLSGLILTVLIICSVPVAFASQGVHPTMAPAMPSEEPPPTNTPTPTPTGTATPVTGLTFTGWAKGCTSGPYITCSATVTSTHTDPYRWDFDITYTYNDNRTDMGSNFSLELIFQTGVFNTSVPIWWEMYPITNEVMPNRWIDIVYSGVGDLNPMAYPSGSWTIPSQPWNYDKFRVKFSRLTGTTEILVRTDSWHVTLATYDYHALTPTPTPTVTLTSTPTNTPMPTKTPTEAGRCQTYTPNWSGTDRKNMTVWGAMAIINTEVPTICNGPYSRSSAWVMIAGGDELEDYAQVGYIRESGDISAHYFAEYSSFRDSNYYFVKGGVASGTRPYLVKYNFSNGKIYMYVGNNDGSYSWLATTNFNARETWQPGWSPEWNGEAHSLSDGIPGTFTNPVYFSNLAIINTRDGPWVAPLGLTGGSTSPQYGFAWDSYTTVFHIWTK